MHRIAFKKDNIIPLLEAAKAGGTYQALIDRAGVLLSPSALGQWITQGRKDREAGQETSYATFTFLWEERHASVATTEAARMDELQSVPEALNPPQPETPAKNGAPAKE